MPASCLSGDSVPVGPDCIGTGSRPSSALTTAAWVIGAARTALIASASAWTWMQVTAVNP